MSPVLAAASAAFALLALLTAVAGARAVRHRRPLASSVRVLTALLCAALAALGLTLSAATLGYRAFTREEVAATVFVQPGPRQSFTARVIFPDGRQAVHELRGDQLYVDAHILKWKALANVLGLHTAYELDRVGGRYLSLDDERSQPRTVFGLGRDKRVDLFDLRRRYDALAFLVDAEYGSATFVEVRAPAVLEIRVSTTGLLVRPREK